VDAIIAHGCNVFINRQLIYNLPEGRLADAGIMSIEHADFDGTERLSLVLAGDIVSTFDTPEAVRGCGIPEGGQDGDTSSSLG
jgi:T-complex protein 1 subunit beta